MQGSVTIKQITVSKDTNREIFYNNSISALRISSFPSNSYCFKMREITTLVVPNSYANF